jgi:branched-subunit amino acid aminotransferase/4-amino-4-deoxychorismate lyase
LIGVKSVSSLHYILPAKSAKDRSFDDAILLNPEGNPIETTSSNIFAVKNKTVVTPPLSQGCLPGVMRKNILNYCHRSGIRTKESLFPKEFLLEADAVFTSNVITGIRKVGKIEEEEINAGFNDIVDGLCEGMSD